MQRNTLRFLALVSVAILTSGCFSVRHSYSGDKIMTSDASIPGMSLRPAGHFEAHDRQFFWLHGGVPVGEDLNGAALAAKQAGAHGAVVNLKITDGQDCTDLAISHVACVLTLLCGTWSVWVEGDAADVQVAQ